MKKTAIILGLVIVLLLVILAVGLFLSGKQPTNSPSQASQAASGYAGQPSLSNATDTKTSLDTNISVPNVGAQNTPANVAVPQSQAPAGPGTTADYRSFNISVNNQAFTPNTIIVKQNDVVNIELTAVGGNYDFTQPDYGFTLQLPEGQTEKLQFSAASIGKFTFYCSSCGGPQKGPVGYLEVTQ